ncbi:MAG: radical SAM protein [Nanoarchaeota archaeon]
MRLQFEIIHFREQEDNVRGHVMQNWYFDLSKEYLDDLGEWQCEDGALLVGEDVAPIVRSAIDEGLCHLTNKISGLATTYVHKNSGIPLIGTNYFGIVDRGTSLLELKPVTSCNHCCLYCSVSEGAQDKQVDFLVEADYLVEETRRVLREKGLTSPEDEVELHFSCHGEPFLYGDMLYLIRKLREIPAVTQITTDTNGTLLTEKYIDQLADAGMTRINISINTFDSELASRLEGRAVDTDRLKKIATYIANHKKMDLLIAPIWLQGVNDAGIREMIEFAREHSVTLGIQNYLNYKGGRFFQKQIDWDTFRQRLHDLEVEYDVPLIMNMPKDFRIRKVKQLAKPFNKNAIVEARVIGPGHNPHEILAAAQERTITFLPKLDKHGNRKNYEPDQQVRLRITRDKHNIFYAEPL